MVTTKHELTVGKLYRLKHGHYALVFPSLETRNHYLDYRREGLGCAWKEPKAQAEWWSKTLSCLVTHLTWTEVFLVVENSGQGRTWGVKVLGPDQQLGYLHLTYYVADMIEEVVVPPLPEK